MVQIVASLMIVLYNRKMFIEQATGVINYVPRVMLKIVASLTIVMYDRKMFIEQATGVILE